MKEAEELVKQLEKQYNAANAARNARFGIVSKKVYGVPNPMLRKMAKPYKNNHELALELWQIDALETRMLATLIDDKTKVTKRQMDEWTRVFDNWAVCDGACFNLFRYLSFADAKVYQYAKSNEEFVRRTAFSLIAGMAIGVKSLDDSVFIPYLDLIVNYSEDERNFVRKAVNWALRQIGKRNKCLHKEALKIAKQLKESENKTARWIGSDAYRELTNPKIIARIK